MKKIIIGIFLISTTCNLNCAYNSGGKDNRYLTEYRTDKCLYDLLSSIVSSNAGFYRPGKYYYSLEFHLSEGRRSLYIAPEMWDNARTLDYSGFINVGGALFLCTGGFTEDSLFHKTTAVKKVMLKLSETEIGSLQSFNEPSLEGTLNVCKGAPIDLSVYTKGKISGYDIKEMQGN